MIRKSLILLFVLTLQNIVFGYTRIVNLDYELKHALLIKEIIVQGYTSRFDTFKYQKPISIEKVIDEMTYSFVDKPKSRIIYKTPNTPWTNAASYYDVRLKPDTIERTINEGYWPAIGDTVLVVIDSTSRISLFAEITDKQEYKFWSPYHTTSWNTMFFSHSPFKPIIPAKHSESYKNLQERAKRWGYEFGSYYGCLIDKNKFWTYIKENK